MNGKWYIDGYDIVLTAGAYILKGSYNEILSPPVPKKRLEHDYGDKHGLDVDKETELVYEAKRFKLNIAIKASSSSDFWQKYSSFFSMVDKESEFSLYVYDLGVTLKLLYEGAKCTHKSSSMRSGNVFAVYELSVLESNPAEDRIYG